MFGLDTSDLGYGETVVLQSGVLGLNAVAYANEGVDGRIDLAGEFGVDHVLGFRHQETVEARIERVRDLRDGEGADVGGDWAGVPDAVAEGVELGRIGGRHPVMGNASPDWTVDFDPGVLTREAVDITPVIRDDPRYLDRAPSFLEANAVEYPSANLTDSQFPPVGSRPVSGQVK